MTPYSYNGKKTKIPGSYQENSAYFSIFFILADLTWHGVRGISTVESEYLLQTTTSHYNRLDSFLFSSSLGSNTARRTYLVQL